MDAYRLTVPGLIPPGLIQTVRGGMAGTVTDDGDIRLSDSRETRLVVAETRGEPDDLEPDAEVEVSVRGGNLWCKTVRQVRGEEMARRRKKRQEAHARKREQDEKRREAEAFWNQYELPFEHGVRIKQVRSGLLRGSSGTGRNASTVEHLFVHEAFEDGRLSREAETYLCDPSAHLPDQGDITRTDADGNEYAPPVTCQTCLERMERFKTEEEA
jgi:hypothetical protein